MDLLTKIHNKLNFSGDIKIEIPEQIMAVKHVKPSACVLELGGSIGRNACVINYILENKKNHVIIEPSKRELAALHSNRDNNNLEFQIENSAISKEPLFYYNKINTENFNDIWSTFKEQVEGSVPVNIITFDQLKQKYPLKFDTLIIDCEGHFVNMLKSFPNILENIKLLIIEHDFNSWDDIKYFNKTMADNNFVLKDKLLKSDKYGPGDNWKDGVIGDPIFVSVWER